MKSPAHSAVTAHTIYYAGLTAFNAGDYQTALQHAHNALKICQEIEHEVGLIKTLCLLLMIARQPGAYIAIGLYKEYYGSLLTLAKSAGYEIEKTPACYESR